MNTCRTYVFFTADTLIDALDTTGADTPERSAYEKDYKVRHHSALEKLFCYALFGLHATRNTHPIL